MNSVLQKNQDSKKMEQLKKKPQVNNQIGNSCLVALDIRYRGSKLYGRSG